MMKTIWVTPPAQVAPYRPAATSRTKAPRSCGELGICQGSTPACQAECAAPAHQVKATSYTSATPRAVCDPDDDLDPDQPDGSGNWGAIAHYTGLVVGGLLSVAVFGAAAGYIYAKWAV